jgi:hypothetical protein
MANAGALDLKAKSIYQRINIESAIQNALTAAIEDNTVLTPAG